MSFSRQRAGNYLLYDTTVENLFLSEYMLSAPAEYVRIYLYALMCAQNGLPLENSDIAAKLSISGADVESCWAYWETQGLIRRAYDDPADRSRCSIGFVNIREQFFAGASSAPGREPKRIRLADAEIAKLFSEVETIAGRLLESGEAEEISSWISEFSIDPAVILLGYRFCCEKRRSNRFKYVGTVLKDWKAKGMDTVTDVEEYLADMDRHYDLYRRVCHELGFHRNPTEPEKKIMDSWFDEMGFPLEKVLEACRKTTGISNPNINYVNSVLTGWYGEAKGSGKASPDSFAAVEKLYERDRAENSRKTEEKRREIFARIPRIAAITEELRGSGVRMSKVMLSGGGPAAVEAEKRRNAGLIEERTKLLAQAGYPADAMDPVYTCPKCRDTGMLDDGSRCGCYAGKLRQISLDQ